MHMAGQLYIQVVINFFSVNDHLNSSREGEHTCDTFMNLLVYCK